MATPLPIEAYTSVGGAAFFEATLRAWEEAGHPVRRVHALDEEQYRAPARLPGRLVKRWQMYAGYAWRAGLRARRSGAVNTIRVVTTNPFFGPAWVQRCAGGRGATINLLYDLFPDALVVAGRITAKGPLARSIANLTRRALRRCEATVFLGEHLRLHAEATYGSACRGVVIPVGADGVPFRDHPPRSRAAGEPIEVLYSGQLGRMHDVETIRGLIQAGVPTGVRVRFQANGSGYARLRAAVGDAPGLVWGGPLDAEAWQDAMKRADIALVTMTLGAEKVVMPSKTYSAMVAGQAILAVAPAASDLADLVRRHECGWVVPPGNEEALRATLTLAAQDREMLLNRRARSFEAGHRDYSAPVVAKLWLQLFASLSGEVENGSLDRREIS